MSGKKHFLAGVSLFIGLLLIFVPLFSLPTSGKSATSEVISSRLLADLPLKDLITTAPDIQKPDWYSKVTITYTISSNGSVADLSEFATLVNQTLNDARGWSRLGARFQQVASGGTFRVILAEAAQLPNYSSGCTSDWSCTVGNSVIINNDRWVGASAAWNSAGGSLRDYRHMVVNHETGHWLGHGHEFCSGAGNSAPVMQQQSIDLQGCKFNPWPLESELFTTRF